MTQHKAWGRGWLTAFSENSIKGIKGCSNPWNGAVWSFYAGSPIDSHWKKIWDTCIHSGELRELMSWRLLKMDKEGVVSHLERSTGECATVCSSQFKETVEKMDKQFHYLHNQFSTTINWCLKQYHTENLSLPQTVQDVLGHCPVTVPCSKFIGQDYSLPHTLVVLRGNSCPQLRTQSSELQKVGKHQSERIFGIGKLGKWRIFCSLWRNAMTCEHRTLIFKACK